MQWVSFTNMYTEICPKLLFDLQNILNNSHSGLTTPSFLQITKPVSLEVTKRKKWSLSCKNPDDGPGFL